MVTLDIFDRIQTIEEIEYLWFAHSPGVENIRKLPGWSHFTIDMLPMYDVTFSADQPEQFIEEEVVNKKS